MKENTLKKYECESCANRATRICRSCICCEHPSGSHGKPSEYVACKPIGSVLTGAPKPEEVEAEEADTDLATRITAYLIDGSPVPVALVTSWNKITEKAVKNEEI